MNEIGKLGDMMRDGCLIRSDDQVRALRKWFFAGNLTYAALAAEMNRVAPVDHTRPHARNADGLVQKLRKAGVIEHVGGSWHLSDLHADNIDAEVQTWALR